MKTLDLVKLALLSMQRNSWEQGVAMDAFFEQGDRDVVIALAKEAAYRRIPDGRPAMIRPDEGITDPCSVGEALIFSFRETDDKDLADACDSLLNWALKSAPRNHYGIVYHAPNRPEFTEKGARLRRRRCSGEIRQKSPLLTHLLARAYHTD